jgi:Plasmid encoded RepA protein
MAEIHRLLEQHGKAQVLTLDLDRRVVEAAAGYLGSEESDVGFLYSGWAQSALPHKRLADNANWQVHTDHVSLVVQPGVRPSLTGDAISIGVPYGSRARLIIIYLQSQALKTQSREIELGRTLHAWLRRLEIPIGGKNMAAVRDQAERISRCRMSFQIKEGNRTGLVNQSILDTAMFVEDDSTQGSLFIERAKLSEMFFEQLKKHPVPIEDHAIAMIANNSMAIDVYCWLAYRLHSLSAPKLITWKALHAQFGRGLTRLDHFRWYFTQNVHLAMAVYPDAKVEVDGPGLTLFPSRPPVAPKIVSLAGTKRQKA